MTRHWFEPVAEHLGAAYLRYSFTKGTAQEVAFLVEALGLEPGMRLLDVGCGPGRHVRALRTRGIDAVGVDISERFVRLAQADDLPVMLGDARRLPVRPGGFDAAISLCQGGFGLPDPARALLDDRDVLAGIAVALRPGGRLALSAFSAYFQLRYLEPEREDFDAATGVNRERTEIRSESGAVREIDLWTACYTPRELRLLCAAVGLRVDGLWSVTPGEYGRHAPTIERPEWLVVATRT